MQHHLPIPSAEFQWKTSIKNIHIVCLDIHIEPLATDDRRQFSKSNFSEGLTKMIKVFALKRPF